MPNSNYCLEFLKSNCYEQYLAVLYSPRCFRTDLAALYAFYLELNNLNKKIKEPLLVDIRISWWIDSLIFELNKQGYPVDLTKEYDFHQQNTNYRAQTDQNNPVILALSALIVKHQLPIKPFIDFCEALKFNQSGRRIASKTEFETYSTLQYGSLYQLAGQVIMNKPSADFRLISFHAGLAQSIVALSFNLSTHAEDGKVFLPNEMLQSIGLNHTKFQQAFKRQRNSALEAGIRCEAQESRERVAELLKAYFYENYTAFKTELYNTPKIGHSPFLPLSILPIFMKHSLQSILRNVYYEQPISKLTKHIRMARAAFFISY